MLKKIFGWIVTLLALLSMVIVSIPGVMCLVLFYLFLFISMGLTVLLSLIFSPFLFLIWLKNYYF